MPHGEEISFLGWNGIPSLPEERCSGYNGHTVTTCAFAFGPSAVRIAARMRSIELFPASLRPAAQSGALLKVKHGCG